MCACVHLHWLIVPAVCTGTLTMSGVCDHVKWQLENLLLFVCCICVCAHVYMYAYIHEHACGMCGGCVHVCICVCLCVCMHICMHACMHTSMM